MVIMVKISLGGKSMLGIKKPRRVAQAGFLDFNRQLARASIGLEQVDNAHAET